MRALSRSSLLCMHPHTTAYSPPRAHTNRSARFVSLCVLRNACLAIVSMLGRCLGSLTRHFATKSQSSGEKRPSERGSAGGASNTMYSRSSQKPSGWWAADVSPARTRCSTHGVHAQPSTGISLHTCRIAQRWPCVCSLCVPASATNILIKPCAVCSTRAYADTQVSPWDRISRTCGWVGKPAHRTLHQCEPHAPHVAIIRVLVPLDALRRHVRDCAHPAEAVGHAAG